ncbi:SufE family protein [Nesterenkonia populi]|uniref:SufE family protein n=1 Tax=Nesterenkonia populi TaxID=1591087 RepID=UPI0011BDC28F|nr:SufE family protein [Nesterenkonia populi]
MTEQTMPQPLQEIVDEFQAVEDRQRLELLLEFSKELPEVPEKYREHLDEMEQVEECQTPLFLTVEYNDGPGTAELVLAAPAEAPTTRGFASIIHQGLNGLTYEEILATPDDLADRLGLSRAITPLRLRGIRAMLGRIKHNVRHHVNARG